MMVARPLSRPGQALWRYRALTPQTRRAWESTIPTTSEISHGDSTPVETITEEKATGHFEVKSNEAVLFFSSQLPPSCTATYASEYTTNVPRYFPS